MTSIYKFKVLVATFSLLITSFFIISEKASAGALEINITSPNGAETLTAGQTYRITWTSSSVNTVSIGYKSCESCLDWITTNVSNTNYYDWNVSVGNMTNTQFKIYVIGYQTGFGSITDTSDNYFTVNPPPSPITITTSSILPDAKVGVSYSTQLNATGGTSGYPYNWSGEPYVSFPPGLNIATAVINGTPTVAGTYNFTLTVTSGSMSASKQFTLTVQPTAGGTIDVISPVAGAFWIRGQTHAVSWQSTGVSGIGKIRLSSCCADASNLESGILDISQVTLSAGSYSFMVPANFPKGVAKLYVMNSDESVYGGVYYVDITDTAGTFTYQNIDGPSDTKVNTWTQFQFTAGTNISDSSLSYKINWGDGQVDQSYVTNNNSVSPFNFSHAWTTAGTYIITFTACMTNNTTVCGVKSRTVTVSSFASDAPTPIPTQTQSKKPLGWLDAITDGNLSGWAVDPDHLQVPINIHVYFDAPAGSGRVPIANATDLRREDVNQVMLATGTHGFKIPIPSNYQDGKRHTVYLYAIDVDDASGGSNQQLYGSPKTFVLGSNAAARHVRGTLVIDSSGTVYFLGAVVRYAFPSPEVFFSWGNKFSDIVLANEGDLAMPIGPVAEMKQ